MLIGMKMKMESVVAQALRRPPRLPTVMLGSLNDTDDDGADDDGDGDQ